tara:strand:+ start:445 stop:681 length:237 start_codon:yes stop_codon:yes gene_type:complete
MRGCKYNIEIKNPTTKEFDKYENLNMKDLIDFIQNYILEKYCLEVTMTRHKISNRIHREKTCSKMLRDITKIERMSSC